MSDHDGPVVGPQLESPSEGIKVIVRFLIQGERMEDASGFVLLLIFSVVIGSFGGYLEGFVYWLALAAIVFEGGLKLLRYWVSAFDGVKCSRILSLWEAYHGIRYALVERVAASVAQGILFTALFHFVLRARHLDSDIPKADHFSSSTRWVLRLYETLIACCVVSLLHFTLGIWVLLGTLALWLITGQDHGWSKISKDHGDLSLSISSSHVSSMDDTRRFDRFHCITSSKTIFGLRLFDQVATAWRNRWMGESQRSAITLYVHERRHPMLTGLAALESDACGLPTHFTARWEELRATLRRYLASGNVGADALAILDGVYDLAGDCKNFLCEDWSTLEDMYQLSPPDARQRIIELMAAMLFKIQDLPKWRTQLRMLPETLDWAQFSQRDSPFCSLRNGVFSGLSLSSLPELVSAAVQCSSDGLKVVEVCKCPKLQYLKLIDSDIRAVHDEWSILGVKSEQAGGESDPGTASPQCHLLLQGCPALSKLTLYKCMRLLDLGNGICQLKELCILDLYGCCELRRLPNELRGLPSLKVLILAGCDALSGLETEEWLVFLMTLHKFEPPPNLGLGEMEPTLKERFKDFLKINEERVAPRTSPLERAGGVLKLPNVQGVRRFLLSELRAATNNFRQMRRGMYGSLYKASLDGRILAVKEISHSYTDIDESVKEIEITAKLHHRNVMALRGYCLEGNLCLVVMDYMVNGSLQDWLFETGNVKVLHWSQCVEILVGVAKGILYLHEGCEEKLIHRDIRPSNILLDSSFEPLVAGFGLLRSVHKNETHVKTRVMGTPNYIDPEYLRTGILTEKSDVFSFGIVMAEVISRRLAMDLRDPYFQSINQHNHPIQRLYHKKAREGLLLDLVAPQFSNSYDEEQARRLISIVLLCIQPSSKQRPLMGQVVQMLTSKIDIPAIGFETA